MFSELPNGKKRLSYMIKALQKNKPQWKALHMEDHMRDLEKMARMVMDKILEKDPVTGNLKARPGVTQAQIDHCKRVWRNASKDYARLARSIGELQGLIDDIKQQEEEIQKEVFSADFAENYLESALLRAVMGIDQQQYVAWCERNGVVPKNLR